MADITGNFIPLTQNKITSVDSENFNYLNQWKWRYNSGYAARWSSGSHKDRRTIFLHRIIMNAPKGLEVDHINGDKLDNKKSNLRLATSKQNSWNSKKPTTNKSGYKGVSSKKMYNGEYKWVAQISVNNRSKHLGLFNTKEDAALCYEQFAREYYKEFAKFN